MAIKLTDILKEIKDLDTDTIKKLKSTKTEGFQGDGDEGDSVSGFRGGSYSYMQGYKDGYEDCKNNKLSKY